MALCLRKWLPSLVQYVDPWVSSKDISKGSRWCIELAEKLDETTYGIICVVPDNVKAPWLNFEAGAISKHVEEGRAATFLLGIAPSELEGPLAQFQATTCNEEDVWELVKSINEAAGEKRIEPERLKLTFNSCWSDLHAEIEPILTEAESSKPALFPNVSNTIDDANFRQAKEQENATEKELEEIEIKILKVFGNVNGKWLRTTDFVDDFGVKPQKMEYYLERLREYDYLEVTYPYDCKSYRLKQKGREYLVKNELI